MYLITAALIETTLGSCLSMAFRHIDGPWISRTQRLGLHGPAFGRKKRYAVALLIGYYTLGWQVRVTPCN
jgi:hypothetical protein